MKKAADLADAKELQNDSTSSGDAIPVHSREQLVSTSCTKDPEIAFTYADFCCRPDTPQRRTSRGVHAQKEDQEERSLSGQELARPIGRTIPPGVAVTTAATTAAVDPMIPYEAAVVTT